VRANTLYTEQILNNNFCRTQSAQTGSQIHSGLQETTWHVEENKKRQIIACFKSASAVISFIIIKYMNAIDTKQVNKRNQ